MSRLSAKRCRRFGGPWLALELIKKLGWMCFFGNQSRRGVTAVVLIIARLCEPSSEFSLAEHFYRKAALSDLLGVPSEKVDDNRLYRALDKLLPHKRELEVFLKKKLGGLFELEYDLLLYDVTNTYLEGEAKANPLAAHGYSRDKRGDCKQVCIGLVTSQCGVLLGYEVFSGNRSDVTTMQEVVETMESRYGKADRIWVMDRGMVSEENIEFLRDSGWRHIVGTPKGMLKKFEQQLLSEDWHAIREELEVQLCAAPDGDKEIFILCRIRNRREKEKAMHARFEEGLIKIQAGCQKRKHKPVTIGKLLGKNSRAAGLFNVDIRKRADGGTEVV